MWKHSVEDHVARGDNFEQKNKDVLNFAAHKSSNEITPAALSGRRLALVSEDDHCRHPSGGLSDSVGMHFFSVFVVVVL